MRWGKGRAAEREPIREACVKSWDRKEHRHCRDAKKISVAAAE